MNQITDRTATLLQYERETRAFYRSLGMSDETADRAIRIGEKALPQTSEKTSRPRSERQQLSSGWSSALV
jgi:hypothetical protein